MNNAVPETKKDEEDSSTKISSRLLAWAKDKLFAPLITLVLGVILGYWINSPVPILRYSIGEPIIFSGEKEEFGLLVVRITNDGRKKADNVKCEIETPDCVIQDLKVVPSIITPQKEFATEGKATISIPFLNPNEFAELAIKASNPHVISKSRRVSVRGDGVSGVQISGSSTMDKTSLNSFLVTILIGGSILACMPFIGPFVVTYIETCYEFVEHNRDKLRKKKRFIIKSLRSPSEVVSEAEADKLFSQLKPLGRSLEYKGKVFKFSRREIDDDGTLELTFSDY